MIKELILAGAVSGVLGGCNSAPSPEPSFVKLSGPTPTPQGEVFPAPTIPDEAVFIDCSDGKPKTNHAAINLGLNAAIDVFAREKNGKTFDLHLISGGKGNLIFGANEELHASGTNSNITFTTKEVTGNMNVSVGGYNTTHVDVTLTCIGDNL